MLKRRIITVEDIRLANDRMMGKVSTPVLSAEDAVLFEKIRRTLPPMKDSPELRRLWKKACEESACCSVPL